METFLGGWGGGMGLLQILICMFACQIVLSEIKKAQVHLAFVLLGPFMGSIPFWPTVLVPGAVVTETLVTVILISFYNGVAMHVFIYVMMYVCSFFCLCVGVHVYMSGGQRTGLDVGPFFYCI